MHRIATAKQQTGARAPGSHSTWIGTHKRQPFTANTQAWRISEQQLTQVQTYLSVEKPRATTRSGSHIIHNTQAWRISEQQLTHVQTYLSVEKPRATTRSGSHIIHNTQAWRISKQQLAHVQTYLSVEKLRATTRLGLYTQQHNIYTFYTSMVSEHSDT